MRMISFTSVTSVVVLAAIAASATGAVTYTALPQYPGGKSTNPLGIWDNKIVGSYLDSGGKRRGFLYDGSSWTDLSYTGAVDTYAQGIWGTSIVGSYRDSTGQLHGFLYDGGSWTPLDWPDGGVGTLPMGICGSRIVGAGFSTSGFLYDSGVWTALQYPGNLTTNAEAISGSNIVGEYVSNGIGFGYLFDGSAWTALPQYPGISSGTVPHGISGDSIVGHYGTQDSYLYDVGTGQFTNLDYPGAVNTKINGIDGNTIVGEYLDSASVWHPIIGVVPEPATLGLLALGGLLACRRRRPH